jgi:hypothetical protein
VRLLAQQGNLFNLSAGRANYRFFDGNAKFNYAISDRTKIYLSLYKGGDAFRNAYGKSYPTQRDTVTDLSAQTSDWGNEIAALRWNQVWRKNLFSNTTLRYSRYQYNSDFNFRSTQQGASGSIRVLADYAQLYQTRIRDYSGKTDFTWYAKNRYQVKFGGSLTNHRFQPGALSANLLQPAPLEGYLDSLKTVLVSNERIGALETEIYIDATIGLGLGWRADIGCNYTSFGSESGNGGRAPTGTPSFYIKSVRSTSAFPSNFGFQARRTCCPNTVGWSLQAAGGRAGGGLSQRSGIIST